MADKREGAVRMEGSEVMRTFVRGRVAVKPEFAQTMEGGSVCRLVVLGKAAGPASPPPRVSLYIRNGDGEASGLRSDEARRCAFGLREGDLIQAVGDVGPERPAALRQEIVVSEPVQLQERPIAPREESWVSRPVRRRWEGDVAGGQVVHCRRESYDTYIGRGRDPETEELSEWGNRYSHQASRVPGVIIVATVEEAVAFHKRWIYGQLRSGAIPLERMAALEGQTLGCWCHQPGPCHGWNLLAAAAWAARQLAAQRG